MSESIEDLTVREYRELIEASQCAGFWFQDPDFVDADIDTVAEEAAETRCSSEFRLRHGVTGARLYFRLPNPGSPPLALKALLEQPFDKGLDSESCFAQKLGEAHAVLAEGSVNRYISPVCSSETILSINVPLSYQFPVLEEAVVIAGRVSIQVQSLHQEIRRPVEKVLESE